MSFNQTKSKKTECETNDSSDIQPIIENGKHVTFNEDVDVSEIECYKSYYNQFEYLNGINQNGKEKCISCGCNCF